MDRKARGFKPCLTRPDASPILFPEYIDSLVGMDEVRKFHADPLGYISSDVDPSMFHSPWEFLPHYWAVESISKYPDLGLGLDVKMEALSAFHAGEVRCRAANSSLCGGLSHAWIPSDVWEVFRRAQRLLHWLLSGITREEILHRARWGPGATSGLSRRQSAHQIKWEFGTHVTMEALPWFLALKKYGRVPCGQVVVVDSNRVTTVPKNAKTDRTIAMEPCWNSFFQLGLGGCIRRRLNRVGLLTADAQEKNQWLAKIGSLTGKYCTIDLKGASDSLSLALCEMLLPADLMRHCMELRSPFGLLPDGSRIEYEKLSSMGNGFTFELETAVFYALSAAVAGDASVYGDDIIVEASKAPLLLDALRCAGMEVNQKKTFTQGPFRESCGGHYFLGIDVTPPYFRRRLDRLSSWITAHNALRYRTEDKGFIRDSLSGCIELLRCTVPRYLWGPACLGDVCLHSDWDETRPSWMRDLQKCKVRGLAKKRRLMDAPEQGAYVAADRKSVV